MRRLAIATVTLLLGASAVVGIAAPASATPADSLYELVNDARAADGLPALARNPGVETVALNWANKMAAGGTLEHNPDYASQLPSGWSASAENVAQGQPSAAAMHADWMASAGHRANILGDYTDVGIAFVTVKGTTWGVQNFAKYGTAPSPSASKPTAQPTAPSPRPSSAPRTASPTPPSAKPSPSAAKPSPSAAKAAPKTAKSPSASPTPSASPNGALDDFSTTSPEPSSTSRSTQVADVDHNPAPAATLLGLALTAATAFIVRATRRARWGKHRG